MFSYLPLKDNNPDPPRQNDERSLYYNVQEIKDVFTENLLLEIWINSTNLTFKIGLHYHLCHNSY